MNLEQERKKISSFEHLELLANQIVEGFISGMHKSPFHGFSAEFAEHKIYNPGESTKYIDWKIYAKTDKLFIKQYQEETNLRCHLILDNSSSMHYPKLNKSQHFYENKIGFSILASAVLMNILKKQRDAVGLSIYSDTYEYYSPEKGSDRHYRTILNKLNEVGSKNNTSRNTDSVTLLHQIAENIKRRSMVILFTDMFHSESSEKDNIKIFKALQHLKYNKHRVVLFHVYDEKTELNLSFDNEPRKFIDIETGEEINMFSENIKGIYQKEVDEYFKKIELACMQYQIQYVPVSLNEKFETIIQTYLVEKQKFG